MCLLVLLSSADLPLLSLGLTHLFKLCRLDASAFLLLLLPVPEVTGHEMLQVRPWYVSKKDKDCMRGQTAAYQLALAQAWLLVLQTALPAG